MQEKTKFDTVSTDHKQYISPAIEIIEMCLEGSVIMSSEEELDKLKDGGYWEF